MPKKYEIEEKQVELFLPEEDFNPAEEKINDDQKMGRVVYPIDNNNLYGAFIDFKIMKIIPPQAKGDTSKASFSLGLSDEENKSREEVKVYQKLKRNNPEIFNKVGGEQIIANATENYNIARNERIKNNKQSLLDFTKSTEYTDRDVRWTKAAVKLYLPVAFQQSDSLNYSGTELGPLGATALAGMSGGKGIASSALDAIGKGAQSVFDLVTGGLTGTQAALASQRFVGKKLGSEVGEAFKIATAVTVNPNLRSTFKGTNLREYSFTFKFIASSSKEARAVEMIIKRFRLAAYPESIPIGPVSAGYKFPDLFEISVFYEQSEEVLAEDGGSETVTRRKRIGNKLKNCYLKSVSTTYNPTVMAFHTDGQPVEIDLTLNFVEEVTIDKQDVKDGY